MKGTSAPILLAYKEELYGILPPNLFTTRDMPSTENNLVSCKALGTEHLDCTPFYRPITRTLSATFKIKQIDASSLTMDKTHE